MRLVTINDATDRLNELLNSDDRVLDVSYTGDKITITADDNSFEYRDRYWLGYEVRVVYLDGDADIVPVTGNIMIGDHVAISIPEDFNTRLHDLMVQFSHLQSTIGGSEAIPVTDDLPELVADLVPTFAVMEEVE